LKERQENYSFIGFAGNQERFYRQRQDKERIQVRDYLKIIGQMAKYIPQKGSLLEVGCATGTILNEFRQAGWNVTGVEPEKWTCEEAHTKYGLNVVNATFQEAGFDKESYDAIIMLHVIEHLPDPCKGLQYLANLLKPGGMFVIETPRYDTIAFKLLRGRERSVCPGHLYYFTRKTLQTVARKAELEQIELQSVGRTVTLDRLGFYAAKLLNTRFTTKTIVGLSDLLRLNKVYLHINLHDMMRVYLRKLQ
jgi:2-polyprenyl-3-methyl-5-hydroxy-6-metoxy-1,4-benzoquinol methylase